MSKTAQRIIILGPAHPLRPGGITTFNERLCKAFIEDGHACSIWSFSLQYPAFLFPGSSQFTNAPAPQGLPILSLLNSVNPINWVMVGLRLRKLAPDVVVVRFWLPFFGPCLGTVLRFAAKNKATKIVCIADNVVPHEKRPGDAAFTRYFVSPIQSFVVMSQQVLTDLRVFTTKPAKLLAHPLYDNFGPKVAMNQARHHLAQQCGIQLINDEPVLLFFGLIRRYKGLDILLDAFALVKHPTLKLLIVGEAYENLEQYTAQLERLQLAGRVFTHFKFVADADVRYFLSAANGLVQPYRSATQSGVSPLAYHFDLPMIVTNVGGLPDLVPHGTAGLVCEPTAQDLAVAIDHFFALGSHHFSVGLAAQKQLLGWSHFVQELLKL
jgi:glycosyltransferase involved in cell wall biosynthesis